MGARKRLAADKRKEEKKQQYYAVLRNCPTSPRKMRLVADSIRGMEVNKALDVLKYSSKEASRRVEKLLLSAIANWQAKNEGVRLEESDLFVKTVMVDSGRILKRLRPAPQGRAHRIRKRSNHVTLYVDRKESVVEENLNQ
ncbi:LSU ribosomal protein L22P [Mariniphaga anaerophila]|uniref:Large ribosomal subunit protein uL22 n=1 Tax=Mariniphaga anaerophila TaxID=1484053 RepID=A0A1M4TDT1_9BACT|nr:50S ribosomal protein L22 [Mariniphaga anaerophila]SHE42610.1 LSU ribosomal protein L22P [Mariniphaga anaerophila]